MVRLQSLARFHRIDFIFLSDTPGATVNVGFETDAPVTPNILTVESEESEPPAYNSMYQSTKVISLHFYDTLKIPWGAIIGNH